LRSAVRSFDIPKLSFEFEWPEGTMLRSHARKIAAIALGVIVTILTGTLLGAVIPSSISYTSAELANSHLKHFGYEPCGLVSSAQ
jgi:hypothetical protein